MKLKNEFVEIKSGKKTYTLKNMILNYYLHLFLSNIVNSEDTPYSQYFQKCFIRLNDNLEFNTTSQIVTYDFDFWFENPIVSEISSINSSTINYMFKANNGMVYDSTTHQKIEETEYRGQKITAIGFFTENSTFAGAILDVSNFDIQYDEGFSVTRKDVLESNGIFIGKKKPYHLKFLNSGIKTNIKRIGFGHTPYEISEKYEVQCDYYPGAFENDQNVSFKILQDGHFIPIPNLSSICKTYLSCNMPLYPTRDYYKYIMFIYETEFINNNNIYDIRKKETYWESIEINKYGNLVPKIRYERS